MIASADPAALWPWVLTLTQILLTGAAAAHVVLHKRDVRAAIGWIGLICLVPFAGAALYALFGINRVRRRASGLRAHRSALRPGGTGGAGAGQALPAAPLPETQHLSPLAVLMGEVTRLPLLSGNAVAPLDGGIEAYRAMLASIDAARRTVGLATYIFDNDAAGRAFTEALAAAVSRGVEVRVLIDGVGARYARPPMRAELERRGVRVAEFNPSPLPFAMQYANLRNHRKILVVDGCRAFTGGMNIREGHRTRDPRRGIADLHFRIDGPVVAHLVETFADDWEFSVGERLGGDGWFPLLVSAGPTLARGIAAGPDEAFERIRWAVSGALAVARERVRILTPYFLPDVTLATLLQLAALRGVRVELVLPRRGNLRLVQWAAEAKLSHLLARGCRIWRSPPPFDHAKVMTVDGTWSLIGSANWDQRSLRLNFEFDVETYDRAFAAALDRLIDARIAGAVPMRLDEALGRSLPRKLRDGVAWLLSPYL